MRIQSFLIKIFIFILSVIIATGVTSIINNLIAAKNFSDVTVENKSSKEINSMSMELCGSSQSFAQIMPEKKVSTRFEINGDCHYSVEVLFQDGKKTKFSDGYVTGGYNFKDTIIIKNEANSIKSTRTPISNMITQGIFLILGFILNTYLFYKIMSLFFNRYFAKKDS